MLFFLLGLFFIPIVILSAPFVVWGFIKGFLDALVFNRRLR